MQVTKYSISKQHQEVNSLTNSYIKAVLMKLYIYCAFTRLLSNTKCFYDISQKWGFVYNIDNSRLLLNTQRTNTIIQCMYNLIFQKIFPHTFSWQKRIQTFLPITSYLKLSEQAFYQLYISQLLKKAFCNVQKPCSFEALTVQHSVAHKLPIFQRKKQFIQTTNSIHYHNCPCASCSVIPHTSNIL